MERPPALVYLEEREDFSINVAWERRSGVWVAGAD